MDNLQLKVTRISKSFLGRNGKTLYSRVHIDIALYKAILYGKASHTGTYMDSTSYNLVRVFVVNECKLYAVENKKSRKTEFIMKTKDAEKFLIPQTMAFPFEL